MPTPNATPDNSLPSDLSHGDHEAGSPYPEDPTQSCRYIGFDMWSCGHTDGGHSGPELPDHD